MIKILAFLFFGYITLTCCFTSDDIDVRLNRLLDHARAIRRNNNPHAIDDRIERWTDNLLNLVARIEPYTSAIDLAAIDSAEIRQRILHAADNVALNPRPGRGSSRAYIESRYANLGGFVDINNRLQQFVGILLDRAYIDLDNGLLPFLLSPNNSFLTLYSSFFVVGVHGFRIMRCLQASDISASVRFVADVLEDKLREITRIHSDYQRAPENQSLRIAEPPELQQIRIGPSLNLTDLINRIFIEYTEDIVIDNRAWHIENLESIMIYRPSNEVHLHWSSMPSTRINPWWQGATNVYHGQQENGNWRVWVGYEAAGECPRRLTVNRAGSPVYFNFPVMLTYTTNEVAECRRAEQEEIEERCRQADQIQRTAPQQPRGISDQSQHQCQIPPVQTQQETENSAARVERAREYWITVALPQMKIYIRSKTNDAEILAGARDAGFPG
ncbi:MAG: hypothetical protein Q8S21_06535 [Candidatus Paracaedibacteraceae bacterium]|nr:hypothetical protein [Candidatus Paracaedibacteraceae bacterium]